MRFCSRYFYFLFFFISFWNTSFLAQEKPIPFYPNGTYVSDIPSPDTFLGFPLGSRPVRYWEVVDYFKMLASKSPNAKLYESGETHEKRKLYYLLVSSEAQFAHLDEIQKNLTKLADPRLLTSDEDTKALIEQTPGVVWLMYSIHGDEISGTDASLQTAYQLVAGTDPVTEKIRKEMIVGIDPMENPDGRERFLSQLQQWNGTIPNSDPQSMQHTTTWPWGRTNHYLFDLNRDWFILAHPETRARVNTLLKWKPLFTADAHEMGSDDTYVFNPPREPINPNLGQTIRKWWKVFSADQGHAFDQYGWSYYTQEWLEEWYPGYGSSWPSYIGSIGYLYEQARTEGSLVKRPDGTFLTFREAIHHQFCSSMANVTTALQHRPELLKDYVENKKKSLSTEVTEKGIGAFYILQESNRSRVQHLLEKLLSQGIEIEQLEKDTTVPQLQNYWSAEKNEKILPQGTVVIRLNQPLKPLIQAILEFEPRLSPEFLKEERDSLEKGKGTRLYEISAWSMLLAYGVEAYCTQEFPEFSLSRLEHLTEISGEIQNPKPRYGFLIDNQEDQSFLALASLLEAGYKVRAARESFQILGRRFSRGTLLLRLHENPSSLVDEILSIAQKTKNKIYGTDTALSEDGPDLGGNDFQLLIAPKIAILTASSIDLYNFGTLWYLLDHELHYRFSILNAHDFSTVDLRKYNVLVLPSTWESGSDYENLLGESDLKKIRDWLSTGGTLIGIKHGAAFLTDKDRNLSKVRLRDQVLKEIPIYQKAVQQEDALGKTEIKMDSILEGTNYELPTVDTAEEQEEEVLKRREDLFQEFYPRGTILRVDLNEEHWLSFGAGSKVPALVETSDIYFSKLPIQTPGRFSSAAQLRISGLLWPEARFRWEKTAYLTCESYEKGQIILFSGEPYFRAYFYGTARLLMNSLFLGPGFGTDPGMGW
ncbi:MAG: M14 family metallopeptidase [Planctomycetota bacterium]